MSIKSTFFKKTQYIVGLKSNNTKKKLDL